MNTQRELTAADLAYGLTDTEFRAAENSEFTGIIGQERAISALKMGLGLSARGYNIFVSGPNGTGKKTAVLRLLEDLPEAEPDDIIATYHFVDPRHPRILFIPRGTGTRLKESLHEFVETLKEGIPAFFKKPEVQVKLDALVAAADKETAALLQSFEETIKEDSFALREGIEGFQLVYVGRGKTETLEDLRNAADSGDLDEKEWERLIDIYETHLADLQRLSAEYKKDRIALDREVRALKREEVRPYVRFTAESRLGPYLQVSTLKGWYEDLVEDVCGHTFLFESDEEHLDHWGNPSLLRYGINVLRDASQMDRAPVIYERHPNRKNLMGQVELKHGSGGEIRTNFMMIRAGSLLRAAGGYLILQVEDLAHEETWEDLKQALETRRIRILLASEDLPVPALEPEPVPFATKVVILGDDHYYETLSSQDPEFLKLFKVAAEFDSVMPRNEENVGKYLKFMDKVVGEDRLLPLEKSGYGEVFRFGVTLAEQRDKLSTHFFRIADLLVESDFWARERGETGIDGAAVLQALETRRYHQNLPEERIREFIETGDLLISVSGTAIGHLNGLAVHERGTFAFGTPTVISARIAPGDEGLVNIEREVGLSGDIHDKWVLILESYLRSRYAQDFPLSLYAAICFEQSYGEIDGDSASSAELYALLSAITEIPLRQDLAVTGSVNQRGLVQPIGGATEKVTGFFDICSTLGLTGDQGVLIPATNVKNLLLPDRVVEAIEAGRFHLYPVETIDQGMELLTGETAGERTARGRFPRGSLNAHAENRLRTLSGKAKSNSS